MPERRIKRPFAISSARLAAATAELRERVTGREGAAMRGAAVPPLQTPRHRPAGAGYSQDEGPPDLGPAPEVRHLPGGELVHKWVHPTFTIVQRYFSVLAEQGWMGTNVSTSSPIKVTIGSYSVPQQQMLFLSDYRFTVLRQSGVDVFDFVEAAPFRFSAMMGFDITAGNVRFADLLNQLDPLPSPFNSLAFQAPETFATSSSEGGGFIATASQAQFDLNAANSFANTAGIGTSLLPVTPDVMGPRRQPFTVVVPPGRTVSMVAVIFRRITAPIAGIAAQLGGHLIEQNVANAILNRVRPR